MSAERMRQSILLLLGNSSLGLHEYVDLKAKIDAIPIEEERQAIRPMSDAPRDGTPLLLVDHAGDEEGNVAIGFGHIRDSIFNDGRRDFTITSDTAAWIAPDEKGDLRISMGGRSTSEALGWLPFPKWRLP